VNKQPFSIWFLDIQCSSKIDTCHSKWFGFIDTYFEVTDSVDDVRDTSTIQDHEATSIRDAVDPPPVPTHQKRTGATNN